MRKTSPRKLSKTNRLRALTRIIGELDYIIQKTPERSMLMYLVHARTLLKKMSQNGGILDTKHS